MYEIKMNTDSLYCLYKNQIPIAIFNASLEHTAAREMENLLNGKDVKEDIDFIRHTLNNIEKRYK